MMFCADETSGLLKSGVQRCTTPRWRKLLKGRTKPKMGFYNINSRHHPRYDLTLCIKQCVQEVVMNFSQYRKTSLRASDYTDVCVVSLPMSRGQMFQLKSYASAVFYSIRQAMCVTEEDFAQSLVPEGKPFYEFVGNTKSGLEFFVSNDRCYFIKVDKPDYISNFRSFLGDYYHHLQTYPHTLLVRILGLYSITMPGQKELYFTIMQSVFYPDSKITHRFDLKGCRSPRYTEPTESPEGLTILMDKNFDDILIKVGKHKEWLIRQLEIDTCFLADIGLQDYSAIVAIESLNDRCKADQRRKEFDFPQKSPSFYNPGPGAQNVRVLSKNAINGISFIDGPSHRYYIGIVDFFMTYKCTQRLRRIRKTIKYCTTSQSTVPPCQYANRMVKSLKKNIV